MAEGTTLNCEPCGYNGISKSARIWCNDCNEGFCDECANGHKLTKILRSHHLLSIDEYLKSTELFIEENCKPHKEPYEYFCSQHDAILCLKCFQENHSKCKITKLSEVAKGSKTSTSLTDLEHDVQSTSQNFAEYYQSEDKSKTDLKQQEQNVRDEVNNIRHNLHKHLKKLQVYLLRDLELKYNNCTKTVNEFNSALKIKEEDMKALYNRISNMKMYASEKQVFIGIRQIGNQLYKQKQDMRENLSKQKKFSLVFKVNDNTQSLIGELKSFGDIVVREYSEIVQLTDDSKRQAQLNIPKHDSIDRINLQLHQSFEIKNPSDQTMSVTACAIFPTKQIVFADNYNSKLIFHDKDYSFSGDITLGGEYKIFDLTPIDSSKVAAETDYYQINTVNIHTKKVGRTITECDSSIWGIYYENKRIYFVENKQIKMIELDGSVLKSIPLDIDHVYNLAVHNNHIYYISMGTKTLYAIDHSGKEMWAFYDNRLQIPNCFMDYKSISLDVDNHGNVFIVLPDYDQVIVVSRNGQQHRVILDASNNLKGPSGISYCRETNQLLVCNVSDGRASIYDIT